MMATRILNAFRQHEKQGRKLSEYQIRLKKLILLASKDQKFSGLLDNGGFLRTIEEYNNPDIQDEHNLHRWLGIVNDSGDSQEDFERNNLYSTNHLWVIYLAFTAAKYKNSKKLQELTDTYEKQLEGFKGQIEASQGKLKKIEDTADVLSKSKVLPAYAKVESKNAEEHDKIAKKWLYVLVVVAVLFIPIVWLTYSYTLPEFVKSNTDETWQFILNSGLAVKFLIVIAWIAVIRFVSKNYYAEKHLRQIALHRASVLKSLHAVYENITNQDEKDSLIKAGALAAFQVYETGYISRKEGAGEAKSNFLDMLSK